MIFENGPSGWQVPWQAIGRRVIVPLASAMTALVPWQAIGKCHDGTYQPFSCDTQEAGLKVLR